MDSGRIYFGSDESDKLVGFSNVNCVRNIYLHIIIQKQKINKKRQKEDIKMQKKMFSKDAANKSIDYLSFTKKGKKKTSEYKI